MKKILTFIMMFGFLFMVTGCGGNGTPESVVKGLLNGMIDGKTNEVAVEYAANPSLLISDENQDLYGLRNAIFSRMSFKVNDVKEYEEEAVVKVTFTTIDMPSIVHQLRKDLEDDSNYKGLAGESKTKYYNQKQVSYVENSKNKDFFRTVELELTVKKDGSKWKVNLSNEFIWTVNGQRGVE